MKRILMVLAATVICGACLFTSCKKDEEETPANLNVAEKIIGKWIIAERDGQAALTNEKMALSFLSTTKGYQSTSIQSPQTETEIWVQQQEMDVVINGNEMAITCHPSENTTSLTEFDFISINDSEFTAKQKLTVTVNGNVRHSSERLVRFIKVTADYSEAILGLWECQGITGGETFNDDNARLEFLADGTYNFYRRSDAGVWNLVPRERNEYFVDGNLLCTRWQAAGEEMSYEWWEIASAADGHMQWTALRQQADGSTFQQGVTWKATEARTVLAGMDFMGHPFYGDLTYSYAYDDDCRMQLTALRQLADGTTFQQGVTWKKVE